jgi:predicted nucleic acid-binding Zn ribbon protein
MPLFTYRCPKTGQLGQVFSAEDLSEDANTHEFVRCGLCQQMHRVNPAAGAVLGGNEQQAKSRNRLAVN